MSQRSDDPGNDKHAYERIGLKLRDSRYIASFAFVIFLGKIKINKLINDFFF